MDNIKNLASHNIVDFNKWAHEDKPVKLSLVCSVLK